VAAWSVGFTAVEHLNLILAVDRNRIDIVKLPTVWQLSPAFDDAVAVIAFVQNNCHC